MSQPIIVHGMTPLWGIATGSPFGLKFETWLRMAEIPYEVKILKAPPKSKTGKIPYIELADGSFLEDSGKIIEKLRNDRGIALDNHLSQDAVVQAHLLRRMIEEHLYYCVAWERWIPDEYWPVTKAGYFGSMPLLLRWFVPALFRRRVRAYVNGMGVGRMPVEELYARGEADMTVISAMLGSKDYMFGQPSTSDAILYGWFGNLLAFPVESPFQRALKSRPNLVAHTQRMRDRYWSATPHGTKS